MNNAAVTQDRRATRLDELAALVRRESRAEQRTLIEAFVRGVLRAGRRRRPRGARPRRLVRRRAFALRLRAQARAGPRARCARSIRPSRSTAGSRRTPSSRSSTTTCRSSSTRCRWRRTGTASRCTSSCIRSSTSRARRTARSRAVGEAGPEARRESFIHAEVDRVSGATALAQLARDVERVLADVRLAVADWAAMRERALDVVREIEASPPPLPAGGARRRPRVPRAGLPTTTSRSSATAATISSAPTARTRSRSFPDRASASCARRKPASVAASFAALPAGDPRLRAPPRAARHHQVDVALDRASSGLPRLHRGQALRRERQRRSARTASSGCSRRRRTARTPPTFRSCGARSRPSSRARGSRPAAMPARRCSTSSRPIRATSSSRPARTTCCARRWASCTCTTASAFASSCDATRSSASCRASSSRRARTTRRTCARSGRRSCMQAFNGTSSEFNVSLSESVLARIHITVRTTPGLDSDLRRARRSSRASSPPRAAGPTTSRHRSSTRSAKRAGNERFRQFAHAFPAGYREEFPARAAVPDIEMMARLTRSRAARVEPVPAARGAARHAALPARAPRRAGHAVRQPADARAHGPARARRASASHHAARHAARSRCTTSASSRRCPKSTWRSTRCTRCSRTRSRGSSAARSRTTTSTSS